jgi:hypothetical protein
MRETEKPNREWLLYLLVAALIVAGLVMWGSREAAPPARDGNEETLPPDVTAALSEATDAATADRVDYETEGYPEDHEMGSWIISGAGDSSYNGLYVEAGTYNGGAYYKMLGVERYLWYLGMDIWTLHTSLGGASPEPYINNGDGLPGTWTAGIGTPPAPTLSEPTEEPEPAAPEATEHGWVPGPTLPVSIPEGGSDMPALGYRPCKHYNLAADDWFVVW